jgi:hypothetical protein
LDANNSQLLKVLRTIKQAKKAANTAAIAPQKPPDSATSQELYDLQVNTPKLPENSILFRQTSCQDSAQAQSESNHLGELDKKPSVGAYLL